MDSPTSICLHEGPVGIEPTTSCSVGRRSNPLSYGPEGGRGGPRWLGREGFVGGVGELGAGMVGRGDWFGLARIVGR